MSDRPSIRQRILVPALLLLVILNLLLLARLVWPSLKPQVEPLPVSAAAATNNEPAIPTTSPSPLPPVFSTLPPDAPISDGLRQQGIMVFSMQDGPFFHLFAYHPQFLPLTRITNSSWDDITPAISPDGTRIAFSSHKSGFWDLYMLDLKTGKTVQLTDTPDYDGSPAWSPDGQWLAYETYHNKNLDIYLLSVSDLSQPPIQLTDDLAADYSPAWSPDGHQIAFVSTRTGEEDIWLGKLDNTENRFTNLTHSANAHETHPAWSPDGRYLAWISQTDGTNSLEVLDMQHPELPARVRGYGEEAIWDPSGRALLVKTVTPNQEGFSVYDSSTGLLAMPFTPFSGNLRGFDWKGGDFARYLAPLLAQGTTGTAAPLFKAVLSNRQIEPAGRIGMVNLVDIQAPYPMLADTVDESFHSLRQAAADLTGWDFLGNLENAFIPLTQPSSPGMEENWLYTGRSFASSPLLVHAGWMVVTREDINGQTFWRVYLKARYQDGSQGIPMTARIWDLDARNNGDPKLYEQGGQLGPIPEGYWVDFTELAGRYGWSRLPALISWITYYPAARFNQFVMSDGLDWLGAMEQIYPPEALNLSTSAPAPYSTLGPDRAGITPTPTLIPTLPVKKP